MWQREEVQALLRCVTDPVPWGRSLGPDARVRPNVMDSKKYDAIVVGSGFGGSVMALRLARAGLRVCVLERGQQYPPGSFPRTPAAMRQNFWQPSDGLQGLFDVWSFDGLDAVVASGVGGGSLIYSNVLLRQDPDWMVTNGKPWPFTRAMLDPHYDQVEAILRPRPYPHECEPYARTPRTRAMAEGAELIGCAAPLRPPLAVAFGNPGEMPRLGVPLRDPPGHNMYGVPRVTCQLCSECNIGCNYGSKHTLDLTYLSMAREAGATILPRCEVRAFWPVDGAGAGRGIRGRRSGWNVEYVVHENERQGQKYSRMELATRTLTARSLILCAGTFGSTFLLLRMREQRGLDRLSPALGSRFSGNGDLLTVILRARRTGREGGLVPRSLEPNFGPVITSAIRVPDALDGGGVERDDERGFYIEDAGFPAILSWLLETAPTTSRLGRSLRLAGRYLLRRLGWDGGARIGDAFSDFIGDTTLTETSLPLVSMGREVPNGVLKLVGGSQLDGEWDLEASRPYLARLRNTCEELARALQGEHVDNPLWHLDQLVTVHPLGGAPMGETPADGVVDRDGRVFGYDGLYVADGSILPGPVGPNPALTIAALAERIAEKFLTDWNDER